MQAQDSLSAIPKTRLGQPVAELPVRDVERAQDHYRDKLGFEPGWIYPGKDIGSVHRGDAAIFFRRRDGAFEPAVHWFYAVDIQATFEEMSARGANITDPLEKKPWGITQFTVADLDGNVFYFHGD
jgi:catechol 2,3-dioxygenase-like lactoylglutathione lyase family enzyme